MTEAWHCKKWLTELDPSLVTPMVRVCGIRYFVNELVGCRDGTLFIPARFFRLRRDDEPSEAYAFGFPASFVDSVRSSSTGYQ